MKFPGLIIDTSKKQNRTRKHMLSSMINLMEKQNNELLPTKVSHAKQKMNQKIGARIAVCLQHIYTKEKVDGGQEKTPINPL
jgi:hypothetical protein